jgi:3',5'-cyclic AMP phosphodiesterase CpdA
LAPDLTILSGDLTMRARRAELVAARKFVDELPQPRFLIPGNHDIPATNHPLERFFNPFRRYREWFGSELEPTLVAEGIHVISVNSNRAFGLHTDWSEGILSQKQLTSIETRFAEASPQASRILVLHHPLLAPPGHGRTVVKPLPGLLHAIDRARIDLVLCGHFHRSHLATAGTLDGWKCIVSQASTVCSTRLQGEPQGFHLIRLSPSHMEITPYAYDGSGFIAALPLAFARRSGGWEDCGSTQTDEVLSSE